MFTMVRLNRTHFTWMPSGVVQRHKIRHTETLVLLFAGFFVDNFETHTTVLIVVDRTEVSDYTIDYAY